MASEKKKPCVVLFPCAGMCHLVLFSRFAANLTKHGIANIVLVTARTTVSDAESHHISSLLSSYPLIKPLWYDPPSVKPEDCGTTDPFFIQDESIRRSNDVLHPLVAKLVAEQPISAFISDIFLAKCVGEIAETVEVPNYVLFVASATMLAFSISFANDPVTESHQDAEFTVVGLGKFSVKCIPPALRIPGHIFFKQVIEDVQALRKAAGILVNTFYKFESEAMEALNSGKLSEGIPRVFPIGPLLEEDHHHPSNGHEHSRESSCAVFQWLDDQKEKDSVVYIAFGSRSALSPQLITELAIGLEKSGRNFLWVLKTTIVDKEETQDGLKRVLPDGFPERLHGRGLVVNHWVDQERVLGHPAVGWFLSHCGWSSVHESTTHGVPMFAWPLGGDQMFNAVAAEKGGLCVWDRRLWGVDSFLKGEEIGSLLKLWTCNRDHKERAERVREEALRAVEEGGDSHKMILELKRRLESAT